MRNHQHGMTLIGMLCILALVGVVVYAGIRLAPLYLNYMKVVRTMESVAAEAKGESPDVGAMRTAIDRHFNIEDPTGVDTKDIEITKDESGVQMHVAYDSIVPYVANISLSVHFEKTMKVR